MLLEGHYGRDEGGVDEVLDEHEGHDRKDEVGGRQVRTPDPAFGKQPGEYPGRQAHRDRHTRRVEDPFVPGAATPRGGGEAVESPGQGRQVRTERQEREEDGG